MGFKMRSLVLIAAVTTSVIAKPELYREKEDFQFSRSSSDDGTKSGYYDAQRGNMGGNYERAHNMDKLAQHQMSGLVRQVEGELGDGSKTRTGSVFSAANSRGIYGSGHYDLSNLEGRNFEEGVSVDDNQSQSSLSNSAYREHSASSNRHSNSYSRHSSSQQSQQSSHAMHNSHLQNANNGYDQLESDAYDQMSGYRYHPQNRLVNTMPMRVMIRPGTKVGIPVATQTYNAGHGASSYDENDFKSDAEVLATGDQRTSYRPSNSKHYESSYRYHKEWEKHDNSNSDDNGVSQGGQRQHDDNQIDSENSFSKDTHGYSSSDQSAKSSQSRHHSDYNSQLQQTSSSNSKSNGYQHSGSVVDSDFLRKLDSRSRPKSYQSSYSYHKSWERQGDPYVIEPSSNSEADGLTSQRLSAASNAHSGHSSHQYGSNYHQAHQSYTNGDLIDCDCDDVHSRVARSYNSNPQEFHAYQHQNVDQGRDNLEQQYQSQWEDSQNLGQRTQNNWNQLENFGQHSQNAWDKRDNLEQQSQSGWNQMADVGQQSQNKWDKIEDLGQQSQNRWDNLEDLGQQSQNRWDKIEDLGQQSQNRWDKLEDLGQQSQNRWDKIEDNGQQTQNKWERTNYFGQHHQSDVGQQQDIWDKLETAAQHKHTDTQQNQWYNIGLPMSQNEDNSGIQNLSNNKDEQFPTQISEFTFDNFSTNRDMFNHFNNNKYNRHLNIWDKLDNFENIDNSNIQESSIDSATEIKTDSFEQDKNTKLINQDDKNSENINLEQPKIFVSDVTNTTTKANKGHVNISDDAIDSEDVGRGDIGSEDMMNMETTESYQVIINNDQNHYNDGHYPQDTDILSLSRNISNKIKHIENTAGSNKNSLLLNNSNIKPETESEDNLDINDNENDKKNLKEIDQFDETTYERHNEHKEGENTQNKIDIEFQSDNGYDSEHLDEQQNKNGSEHINTQKQFELEQNKKNNKQNKEIDNEQQQSNLNEKNDFAHENFNQQNVESFVNKNNNKNEKNIVEQFGQDEGLDQKNVGQFNIDQQNDDINKENIEHKFDFGQHSSSSLEQNFDHLPDFDKINENSHGQNMAQNFDIGEHENFNQQNIEQLPDFGQESDNLYGQNMKHEFNIGQQSEKLNKQNVEEPPFFLQNGNLYGQNMMKQFDIGQQNEKFNHTNVEVFDIEQQNQNFNQQNVDQFDIGQQNENFNQQNVDQFDIGQQNENFNQQNFDQFDIGQQNENFNQQNIDQFDIGQQNEKFNQQNVDQFDIGQQNENFNQRNVELIDLGHQNKNLNEQYIEKQINQQLLNQQGRNLDNIYSDKVHEMFDRNEKNSDSSDIHNSKYSLDVIKQDDKNINNSDSIQVENKANEMSSTTTPVPIIEKKGFWASVGTKLTSAKNKIGSWFKRS